MTVEKTAAAPGSASRGRLGGALQVLETQPLFRHVAIAVGGVLVLVLVTYQVDAYTDYQLAAVGFFTVAAAGLNLLTGVNGQLSLGHGALMAIGAYVTALVFKRSPDAPLLFVIVLALSATAIAGALVGVAAARLRGPYLAGATLALAVALPQVPVRFSHTLGGEEGITVPPPAVPAFLGADFPEERWLAWISLFAAVVTLVLLANLLHSSGGRALRAVRDNEVAARLAGIGVGRTQVIAFVISAACAGLAGSLLALWAGLAAPAGFSLGLSLQLLTAIVIGGLGRLAGAVWGSAVLVLVPALTGSFASTFSLRSEIANNLPLAIYGMVLVLVMLVFPGGIQGGISRLAAAGLWWRRRRG